MSSNKKVVPAVSAPALAVPNDAEIGESTYSPLPAGIYQFTVDTIDVTEIKGGPHQGKLAFNVKLKTESNRVLFKLIPMWQAGNDAKEVTWIRMARVSFVEALGINNEQLFNHTEKLIGSVVQAEVSAKDNGAYGVQNFVVKFVK
jgi:hypothetical protein